jgi:uncharacterized repeat protein (TIGR02543 family)
VDTPGITYADEWSGIYFEGIPIKLTAVPNSGYEFAGWDGIEQTSPKITIDLNEDLVLTANFILDDL